MPSNADVDVDQFVTDTKSTQDDHGRALKELRSTLDSVKGTITGYDKEKMDRLHTVMDGYEDKVKAEKAEADAKDARIKALEEKAADLEAALKNPATADQAKAETEQEIRHKAAFTELLQKGKDNLSPESRAAFSEAKALTVGSAASAGNLAPTGFYEEIQRGLSSTSPIRQYARVISINDKDIEVPVETGQFDPAITAENTAKSDDSSSMQFAKRTITPQAFVANIAITDQMKGDAFNDLEGFIQESALRRFRRIEGVNFVQGSGAAGSLNGLQNAETDTAISNAVTLTGATRTTRKFNFEQLLDLLYAVPSEYAANGIFAWNRGFTRLVRGLKDSDGQYILQDGFSGQSGAPSRVLGHAYIECPDIPAPGATNIAANAKIAYFGDFSNFWIADRSDLSVLEDPYTGAANLRTRFVFSQRVGSTVMISDAFRAMNNGA